MQPIEAADLYVSDLRKRTGLERLKVLNDKPAQVGGKPGLQLVLEFKNDTASWGQITVFANI